MRRTITLLVLALWCADVSAASDPASLEPIATVQSALAAARDGDFERALVFSQRSSAPIDEKLVVWYAVFRSATPPPFTTIAKFLADNPHWPRQRRIRTQAEKAIPKDYPPNEVVTWFEKFPPVSTLGRRKFAHALAFLGRPEDAAEAAKKAWTTGDFTNVEQREFLLAFLPLLNIQDHRLRLDRLLWNGQVSAAERMLHLLPSQDRQIAIERIKLRLKKTSPQAALAQVSADQHDDPGLKYDMVRWYRQQGENEQAVQLIETLPSDVRHAAFWWDERAILARRFLAMASSWTAYRLTANHSLQSGADFADAEWLAGWIALRFNGDPQRAYDHFTKLYDNVRYPISRARGAYWAARAADAMDQDDTRDTWYGRAARHQNVYYGQLAHEVISPGTPLRLPINPAPGVDDIRRFQDNELVRAARTLALVDDRIALRMFILHIARAEDTPQWRQLTAMLAESLGRHDLAVFVARRADRDGYFLLQSGYPIIDLPRWPQPLTHGFETALVHAVIRQESSFDVQAISPAGARGLMQLMPATARSVARTLDLQYALPKLTSNPEYNLSLGQAYLSSLLARFSGSYVLSLVGYNAGPGRAERWLQTNGDPREGLSEAIDWVEKIPFSETRNYVQRTLENVQVYRARLTGAATSSSLQRDLVR